ncbi:MAG: NADP-dependent oxidoreductase [Propionibacteriaceae bacterium]|nr:NADP-dependent oxidoreductase [Propionibacteriaceae bacterium]
MREAEMWAVQYRRYGGPEVLELGSVPVPRPKGAQVLVEVAAFSVNQADLMARAGKLKGINGFGFPKGTGVDFAGTVVEPGPRATRFKEGDRVWGYIGMKPPGRHAAAARYVVIQENRIAEAPSAIGLVEAAALPLVGLTAVQALRALRVAEGQRVLVVGGNGGVGSTTVQVARALGAQVDAVVGNHAEAAERAGAVHIHNRHLEDIGQLASRYDALVLTAGDRVLDHRRLLAPRGRIVALAPAMLPSVLASLVIPGPIVRMISAGPSASDLAWLSRKVDDAEIVPIIGQSYALDDVVQAHHDAENEAAGGKRVIRAG